MTMGTLASISVERGNKQRYYLVTYRFIAENGVPYETAFRHSSLRPEWKPFVGEVIDDQSPSLPQTEVFYQTDNPKHAVTIHEFSRGLTVSAHGDITDMSPASTMLYFLLPIALLAEIVLLLR
ncbi:MAG TPA: hypothetical protein VHV83_04330, partial [Armatimonadota bacterium]|nr:hypothetical protein [Armatimonadota bacterium]